MIDKMMRFHAGVVAMACNSPLSAPPTARDKVLIISEMRPVER